MSVAETGNPMNIILFTVLAIAFTTVIVVFTRPGEDELVELRDVATQADVEQRAIRAPKGRNPCGKR